MIVREYFEQFYTNIWQFRWYEHTQKIEYTERPMMVREIKINFSQREL